MTLIKLSGRENSYFQLKMNLDADILHDYRTGYFRNPPNDSTYFTVANDLKVLKKNYPNY